MTGVFSPSLKPINLSGWSVLYFDFEPHALLLYFQAGSKGTLCQTKDEDVVWAAKVNL